MNDPMDAMHDWLTAHGLLHEFMTTEDLDRMDEIIELWANAPEDA